MVPSCNLRENSGCFRFAGLVTLLRRDFFPIARHILQRFPTTKQTSSLKIKRQSYSPSDKFKKSDMRCEQCVFWQKDNVSCQCFYVIKWNGIRLSGSFKPVIKIVLCLPWKGYFEMSKINGFIAFHKQRPSTQVTIHLAALLLSIKPLQTSNQPAGGPQPCICCQ